MTLFDMWMAFVEPVTINPPPLPYPLGGDHEDVIIILD